MTLLVCKYFQLTTNLYIKHDMCSANSRENWRIALYLVEMSRAIDNSWWSRNIPFKHKNILIFWFSLKQNLLYFKRKCLAGPLVIYFGKPAILYSIHFLFLKKKIQSHEGVNDKHKILYICSFCVPYLTSYLIFCRQFLKFTGLNLTSTISPRKWEIW